MKRTAAILVSNEELINSVGKRVKLVAFDSEVERKPEWCAIYFEDGSSIGSHPSDNVEASQFIEVENGYHRHGEWHSHPRLIYPATPENAWAYKIFATMNKARRVASSLEDIDSGYAHKRAKKILECDMDSVTTADIENFIYSELMDHIKDCEKVLGL
jgi:hypothetical protein